MTEASAEYQGLCVHWGVVNENCDIKVIFKMGIKEMKIKLDV